MVRCEDKGCSKNLPRTTKVDKPRPSLPYNEKQLHGIFSRFDTDHDDRLSQKELTNAFHSLGSRVPAYRAWRALHHADANKDGFVSEDEFQQLVKKIQGKSGGRSDELGWIGSNARWLDIVVVGVLKIVTDVSTVVKDLLDRHIFFTFYYIGDKNVIWNFRSLKDRDSFINNRVLWGEFFSSVLCWSDAITPHSRLEWVEFQGVPLDCWCENFFRRLGWAVGEPLMFEEETLNRDNLFRGRVLVLIPYTQKCPNSIKVLVSRKSFSMAVWENPEKISYDSILNWLGLKCEEENSDSNPQSENSKVKEVGGGNEKIGGDDVACNLQVAHTIVSQHQSRAKGGGKVLAEVEESYLEKRNNTAGMKESNKCNGKGGESLKKSQITRRPTKFKEPMMLEKEFGNNKSSSLEMSERGFMVVSLKYMGETSKVGLGQEGGGNIVVDLGCGLIDQGQNETTNVQALKALSRTNNTAHAGFGLYYELDGDKLSSSGNQVSHVSTTKFSNVAGEVSSKAGLMDSRRIRTTMVSRNCSSSLKSHSMTTRKDKKNVKYDSDSSRRSETELRITRGIWNLKEEMAKVNDKGVALGVICGTETGNGSASIIREWLNKKKVRWSLCEEVDEVIEVGVALGFDFNGNEKIMEQEVGCREMEDMMRFKAQQ
ncbi:hypothetical protein Ddye_006845 [Dipteronia dyeriana]|uniref:EF-hand domain-containing protein n=1 Tax=Dipteronia dyeriana TaxID=168575 RepID=A0AAE0CR28_9ROSI|nr:hypothetical protein Ddye_006845 [Dipteronia dyeriana]